MTASPNVVLISLRGKLEQLQERCLNSRHRVPSKTSPSYEDIKARNRVMVAIFYAIEDLIQSEISESDVSLLTEKITKWHNELNRVA